MKNIFIAILLLFCTGIYSNAQSISQPTIGTAGGQFKNGTVVLNYTIGEPIISLQNDRTTNIRTGFWHAQTSVNASVLAVIFGNFSALAKDNNALLQWQVANETSFTDHYEIERNLNAISFKKIGSVQARVNTGSVYSYYFTDLNLSSVQSSGIFYYRIKQVDKDGHFIYSSTKMIRVNNAGIVIGLHPNPVKNFANVSIDVIQQSDAGIMIYDMNGRQVKYIKARLSAGANIINIDISKLAAGCYMLKVQTPAENKTVTIVKTN
jgi:Secretion system C-terminal sorting domain